MKRRVRCWEGLDPRTLHCRGRVALFLDGMAEARRRGNRAGWEACYTAARTWLTIADRIARQEAIGL